MIATLLLVGVVWLAAAIVVAFGLGRMIHRAFDDEAPANVTRRDWQRVTTRRM